MKPNEHEAHRLMAARADYRPVQRGAHFDTLPPKRKAWQKPGTFARILRFVRRLWK